MTATPALRATASLRPEQTARLMDETGLDDDILRRLVHRFYDRVRVDLVLGPIFDTRITDWEPHLERMVAFWSSVALMSGRYHGAPVTAHANLPLEWSHFERWLDLFRQTAVEVCPPRGATHVIDRAESISKSLHMAVQDTQRHRCPPHLT